MKDNKKRKFRLGLMRYVQIYKNDPKSAKTKYFKKILSLNFDKRFYGVI